MSITRGTISVAQQLEPGLRKTYNDAGDEFQTEYTQFMQLLTSSRRYEEDAEYVTLGPTPTKAEGATTSFDDPIYNSNQKRYVHVARGLATRITHEAIADDQYGTVKQIPGDLRRSNMETVELSAINLLINGFAAGLGSGTSLDINGEVLFHNTGHSKLNGGTYDPNGVTDAYGFTALQAMYNYYESQTNDRGMHMRMVPGVLVLPFELRFVHREIWGSAQRPFTSDNEVNSMLQEPSLRTVFTHFSTSSTAWWSFGTDADRHLPKFFWREKETFATDDDFLTGDVLAKTYMRYSLGMTKAVGCYGSTGV